MRIAISVGLAVSVATFASRFVGAQQTPPPCNDTPGLAATWALAWRSLGIGPAKGDRPLGDAAAKRWFGSGNWYPVDGTDQTMCGILRDWSVYNGEPFTPHELDIHPYLTPSREFAYLIEDLPLAAHRNTETCQTSAGSAPCVWGEVTSVSQIGKWLLGKNFPKQITKPYKDHTACMFGPWVMERVHGWRSEIHPYRAFWAARESASSAIVDLLLVRDSTDRYTRPDQFSEFGPRPPSVWSNRSVDEVVGLSWELAEAAHGQLTVTELEKFGLTDGAARSDIVHEFGDRSVRLDVPGWMKSVSHEACSVRDGNQMVIRGIDWLAAKVDPPGDAKAYEGAAVVLQVKRSATGLPPVTSFRDLLQRLPTFSTEIARLFQKSQEMQLPPRTAEPSLRLDILSVETADETRDARLNITSQKWHLTGDAARSWQVMSGARVRLRPYYTGITEDAERKADRLNEAMESGQGPAISISWTFKAEGWDNVPKGGLGIGPVAAYGYFGVQTFGGDGVRTGVPATFRRHPLATTRADRWRAELAVEAPSGALDRQVPLSAVLVATATLKDSAGRTSSRPFRIELYSHTPQIAGQSGRDPSPEFVEFVGQWLAMQRPELKLDAHEIATTLSQDLKEQVVDTIHGSAAIRRAQILRITYLTRERADYLSADDLAELLTLARVWSDVRWPK
jgi:hypothetical protein